MATPGSIDSSSSLNSKPKFNVIYIKIRKCFHFSFDFFCKFLSVLENLFYLFENLISNLCLIRKHARDCKNVFYNFVFSRHSKI